MVKSLFRFGRPARLQGDGKAWSDQNELRAQTVQAYAYTAIVVACVLLLSDTIPQDGQVVAIALVLSLIAGAALGTVERDATLAAVLLMVGLLVDESFAQHQYPAGPVPYIACLVVLIAVQLLGWIGGLTAVTVGVADLVLSGPPTPLAVAAALLAGATAFLAWLGTRAVHTAVGWSLQSYQQARAKTEEARERQAELVRLSANLRHAYAQLQRSNEELERARSAAEEARTLKVEFATTISHELRTPLNLVIGFSEMMVLNPRTYAGETLPDTYRGDIEAIYRNACHLSNLIDDVLDLSQIDARQMALHPERFDLRDVIGEATTAVDGLFADKGVSVRVDCPPDLPRLVADRTRIRQVLMNLLANAARFTERGQVIISARSLDGAVEVAVADTGAGMPVEDLDTIFTAFHQIGSTRQRHTSGLGLAICKRLVELHGGRIWAESRSGVGSTFTFSLPHLIVDAQTSAAWETWATVDDTGAHPTIAVVSDDPDILRLLSRHLSGYAIKPMATVSDAIDLAEKREARALFVTTDDDYLASMRGSTAPVGIGVPVVACSFTTTQAVARSLGAAAYLPKPVTRERLRTALPGLGSGSDTILVVDDQPEMVRLLTRMLHAEAPGCEVLRADGGRAALALLEHRRPTIVLLDLLMPDVDGYSVLQRIRADATLRDVRVVIVSARGSDADRIVASELRITRLGGLPMTDVLRCLQSCLDALAGELPIGNGQGQPAVHAV